MILVVVGAGYIGSDMVKDLLRDNYEVLTLDDLSKATVTSYVGARSLKAVLEMQRS
jgi:UDP-glucose 4-epimerase